MLTTLEQITKIIKKPLNSDGLRIGGRDNDRISFHAVIATDQSEASSYYNSFVQRIHDVIGFRERSNRVVSMISFPLHTSRIINRATDDLNQIFSAEDRYIECRFEEKELVEEFQDYLNQKGFDHYVQNDLFGHCLATPNGIIVVDLPSEASTNIEPYWYFIPFQDLHHLEQRDGVILSVGWKRGDLGRQDRDKSIKSEDESEKEYVFIDSTGYFVLDITKGDAPTMKSNNPHKLGYCPVSFIWHDPKKAGKLPRLGPLTGILTDLDEYEFDELAVRYSELYGVFPIYWFYDQEQYGERQDSGDETGNGFDDDDEDEEYNTETTIYPGGGVNSPAPASKIQSVIGVGSYVKVTKPPYAMNDGSGSNSNPPPMGWVNPDVNIFKYNKERVEAEKERIQFAVSGTYPPKQGDAYNQDQIASQYEVRKGILQYWSQNFEITHKFLVDTIARLKYGELYVGSIIQYGQEFFLLDRETALKEYNDAKLAGVPMYLLEVKRDQLVKVESRQIPAVAERIEIMKHLEPFPDLSMEKVMAIGVSRESPDYMIKVRFSEYIQRFELENGPITEFGITIPDAEKRIELIKLTIQEYVKQESPNTFEIPEEQGLGGGRGGVQKPRRG